MTPAAAVLLATLAASPSSGSDHPFPLAAAMVHGGKLFFVNVPSREATPVPIGDLVPEEADLSPNRAHIAVTGRRKGNRGGPARLFIIQVGTWEMSAVEVPASGDCRFPRFETDSRHLLFSAAGVNAQGGPANPLRIHRLDVKDRNVVAIKTKPGNCEFSPVPWRPGAIAHVTTGCSVSFDIALTELQGTKTKILQRASGPTTELAGSPDGKRLIFTAPAPTGIQINALEAGKLRRVATINGVTVKRLQPRFICPKDLVFVNRNRVWVLDTKSGDVSELLVLK